MLNVLKKLRSWCPQPQDRLSTKIKSYSKPTAIVVGTLILAISVTFIFTQYALTQSVAQAPIIKTPTENSLNASIAPISEPTPTPNLDLNKTNSLLTQDQALSIAMPIIQQYAEENNRKIDSVNATLTNGFWKVSANFQWAGPPSLVPVNDENGTVTNNPQLWIFGYVIDIKPESGEIFYSQAQGVM